MFFFGFFKWKLDGEREWDFDSGGFGGGDDVLAEWRGERERQREGQKQVRE